MGYYSHEKLTLFDNQNDERNRKSWQKVLICRFPEVMYSQNDPIFVFLKDLFLYTNHRVCPNLGSITFGDEDLGQFLKTVVVNLLPLSNSNKENLVMIYHGLLL